MLPRKRSTHTRSSAIGKTLFSSVISHSDAHNGCVPLRWERCTSKASAGPYGIRHAVSDPLADSYSYSDTDRDSYCDGNPDENCHAHSHSHSDSDSDSDAYSDPHSHSGFGQSAALGMRKPGGRAQPKDRGEFQPAHGPFDHHDNDLYRDRAGFNCRGWIGGLRRDQQYRDLHAHRFTHG
jgi:hypothetical protein